MRASNGAPTTVRFFEQLYAIVVGLGLALVVEQLLDFDSGDVSIATGGIPVFLAYLNFAFPLAHASVRYLDLAYVERQVGTPTKGRVLVDLGLGTGHFVWLIALAFLTTNEKTFVLVAMVLLIGRPLRDGLLILGGSTRLAFDRSVAWVHLVTVVCLAIVYALTFVTNGSSELWTLRIGVLAVSLVFALGLYLGSFSFFFGTDED